MELKVFQSKLNEQYWNFTIVKNGKVIAGNICYPNADYAKIAGEKKFAEIEKTEKLWEKIQK